MTAPRGAIAGERSRPSVAGWVLRALLWLGVLAALAAAAFLVLRAGRAPPADGAVSDLPDMGAVAEAGAWIAVLLSSAVTLPMLLALRRPRPWLARLAVVAVTLAWVGVSAALWVDVRENWDCAEMQPSIFVVPLWLASIVVLASSAGGRRELGLTHGPLVIVARVLVLGALAGLVAGDGACLAGCERPADARLARLHVGQSRVEALALLDGVCERSGGSWSEGVRYRCAPRGPAICACAPAPARAVTLAIGADDRLVRVTARTVVGAMRRPR